MSNQNRFAQAMCPRIYFKDWYVIKSLKDDRMFIASATHI